MSECGRDTSEAGQPLSIAAVAHEIGIAKDRLRVWERRYGFPLPLRDAGGDRVYPAAQVAKLKLIKRLLDVGHRPQRLLALDSSQLTALLAPARAQWHDDPDVHAAIEMLRGGDLRRFDVWIRGVLVREGLDRFVLGAGRAIVNAVGDAWDAGAIGIWHEHYFSAAFQALLNTALAHVAEGNGPRVLFATPSGERHGLGLLMARALFAARGAACIVLGEDIPTSEIIACADRCDVDIVALSVSVGFQVPRAAETLAQLRERLSPRARLWVGGAAAASLARARGLDGVSLMRSLEDGVAALEAVKRAA